MKCYNHNKIDAIGLCKTCSKGICIDCSEEIEFSLACKGKCIERAEMIDNMISNNSVTYSSHKKNKLFMPAFFCGMGAVILFAAYMNDRLFDPFSLMGVLFIIFGIITLITTNKWVKKLK